MGHMFENAYSFRSDLSRWDTSKVTKMDHMFANASFFESDLSYWDTSKVQTKWTHVSRNNDFSSIFRAGSFRRWEDEDSFGERQRGRGCEKTARHPDELERLRWARWWIRRQLPSQPWWKR